MDFKTPPRRSRIRPDEPQGSEPADKPEPLTPEAGEPVVQTNNEVEDTSKPEESDKEMPTKAPDYHIPKPKSQKKKLIILAVLFAILLAAAGGGWWFVLKPNHGGISTIIVPNAKEEVKAPPVSPLTGVTLTDEALAKRPVTGIMIENSPDARPQSGLLDAGIVYEAIAEGGITRFLAVYQDTAPNYIGPVRSARPYYVDFVAQYDASYAHVGGSPEALNDIKALGIRDLDQFYNGNYYTRITQREAPHNVYTGFDKLDALNAQKGYTSSTYTPFVRKADVPQTPLAGTIDFNISSPLYSPEFVYDATTNTYKRFQDGEPHVDAQTNTQISPKVVIALVMNKSYDPDGYHTDYQTVGSGKMYVFQDGIVSEGTWQKADRKAPIILTDKNGFSMQLNAGQTWISIVANQTDVNYRP